jgi:peptidoglycan/LPS O-acetylase OafA/YrhL
MYFEKLWKNKWIFLCTTLILGALFIGTQQWVLVPLHRSLSMYDNKYPPNIYHIAYSLFAVNIVYGLSRMKIFSAPLVQGVVHFFSIYSYSLFFIHILVIEAVWKWVHPTNWVLFFLLVIYGSALIQMMGNALSTKFQKSIVSQH